MLIFRGGFVELRMGLSETYNNWDHRVQLNSPIHRSKNKT